LAALFVPPLPATGGLPAFQGTIARLRAPDGCPWDREQTHLTLRQDLLEEAYEAIEALDDEDSAKLCEELGDLLMQIVMHAQLASEAGDFRLSDVVGQIDAKLKRRHPHVFGDVTAETSDAVLRNWEKIKEVERNSASDGAADRSRLSTVPIILPALARAQSLADRAARVGFDWPDIEGVLGKVEEELQELQATQETAASEAELGDLLFTLVNVARWLNIDAEGALRGACSRFTARFSHMEQLAETQGLQLAGLSPAELDALWEQAKLRELAASKG
jgi:tetrapyrrole methylase family protein/MazG family protein